MGLGNWRRVVVRVGLVCAFRVVVQHSVVEELSGFLVLVDALIQHANNQTSDGTHYDAEEPGQYLVASLLFGASSGLDNWIVEDSSRVASSGVECERAG